MNEDLKESQHQKYLISKHAKLKTSNEILEKVVKEGTGHSIYRKRRIIAGEVNEVYDVTLENGQNIILRISRSGHPNFLQEKWALEKCQKIGVPVPKILFIKYLKLNNKDLSFCLMEKINGEPLEKGGIEFRDLNLDLRKGLMRQAGEILSKIHSIKTEGYGWITGEGDTEYKTADELLFHELISKKKVLEKAARDEGWDISLISKSVKIIENFQKDYRKLKTYLNHGDYGNKHFIVRDNKIVGVLDWGGVRSDSPIFDFARWDFWFGEDVPTDWLKEGYLDKDLFNYDFEEIFHMLRIFFGLKMLEWYHQEKYKWAVDYAKKEVNKDLKYFA